ncbi:MAG: hypothetical protein JOS17DRAFT_758280 [Linnemannia elongata]|nr:MAG: hypothetical protein JOS17DRAFT_758280 [Linnemannia elongata]
MDMDFQVAMDWCTLAAAQGYAKSQFNIGVMYGQGLSAVQDFVRAAEFCRLAAEGGYERS